MLGRVGLDRAVVWKGGESLRVNQQDQRHRKRRSRAHLFRHRTVPVYHDYKYLQLNSNTRKVVDHITNDDKIR